MRLSENGIYPPKKMTCGKLLIIRWNWVTHVSDRPIWVGCYLLMPFEFSHIDVLRSHHPALHELIMIMAERLRQRSLELHRAGRER